MRFIIPLSQLHAQFTLSILQQQQKNERIETSNCFDKSDTQYQNCIQPYGTKNMQLNPNHTLCNDKKTSMLRMTNEMLQFYVRIYSRDMIR